MEMRINNDDNKRNCEKHLRQQKEGEGNDNST